MIVKRSTTSDSLISDEVGEKDNSILNSYPKPITQIRATEYPHLRNKTYLDHAGMTIYSKTLLIKTNELLLSDLFANPHSQSLPSINSTDSITQARLKALRLFNADPLVYDIAFTLNSTHAIKILSSCFADRFQNAFNYYYHIHSHTSIIGVREIATKFKCFENPSDITDDLSDPSIPNLIAWTGQSNLNGDRYPIIPWNKHFKSRSSNNYTLLDASSLSTTSPPDLSGSVDIPDFVVVSFYKMFGLPDIGALIFKKDTSLTVFPRKKYFGGGTVDAVSAKDSFKKFKNKTLHSIIEDGTLPIHSILQLSLAIDCHLELYGSFKNISTYTTELKNYTNNQLKSLKYSNNSAMVKMYESKSSELGNSGPIIAFSLCNNKGDNVGYYDFEQITSLKGVSFRTGTVCNPGGIQHYLNRTTDEIIRDYGKGHKCGDRMDVLDGKPTGLIRISFGAMTLKSEIDDFIENIKEFLLPEVELVEEQQLDKITIEQLIVYPLKSCQGYSIPSHYKWPITKNGLLYDREFLLINLLDGSPMILKNHKKMCFLKPILCDDDSITITNTTTNDSIKVDIDISKYQTKQIGKFIVVDEGLFIQFFQRLLDVPCTLAKSALHDPLQNKSSFLLTNLTSLRSTGFDGSLIERFRSNIVIKSNEPFEEDSWRYLKFNESKIILEKLCDCDRCHMITITNEGKIDSSLFLKLAKSRKRNGRIYFGINLNVSELGLAFISIGDKLSIL